MGFGLIAREIWFHDRIKPPVNVELIYSVGMNIECEIMLKSVSTVSAFNPARGIVEWDSPI